jgi:hypothetical protein
MYTDLPLMLIFLSINNVTIILEKTVIIMLESGLTYVLLTFKMFRELVTKFKTIDWLQAS